MEPFARYLRIQTVTGSQSSFPLQRLDSSIQRLGQGMPHAVWRPGKAHPFKADDVCRCRNTRVPDPEQHCRPSQHKRKLSSEDTRPPPNTSHWEEEAFVNKHSVSKGILRVVAPALVLLLSASVWAADAASSARRGSMDLLYPASVAGTQLPAGKYRVEWKGAGDQVEVNIYRGDKAVVSTHARLVKDDKPYDCVSLAPGEKGTKVLTQISFGKEKQALRLDNQSSGSDTERAAK